MESWSFLTNHARVLLCIAHDPGARLRDTAASLGITDQARRLALISPPAPPSGSPNRARSLP
jgi:hypothetical protein